METQSAPPLIIEQGSNQFFSSKRISKLAKPFFVILIAIILVEVFLAFKSLTVKKATAQKLKPLSEATLSLIPDKVSYKKDDSVFLLIRVDTGGHNTVGSDLSLKFDPSYLSLIEASASANFLGSSIYSDFPIVKIDKARGTIQISGIVSPSISGFNGIGVFGELAFKALKTGHTEVSVLSKPGGTTLSTVVEAKTAKNILGQVKNADFEISTTAPSSTHVTCNTRVERSCLDNNGQLGSYWCSTSTDPFACKSGCFQDKMSNRVGCNVISQ